MKTTVNINGKEVEIELTNEQVKEIINQLNQHTKTGYEPVEEGTPYYFSNNVSDEIDSYQLGDDWDIDELLYDNANYYSDKTIAENNARADKLFRQLRRFAVEHRQCKLYWNATSQSKVHIYFDHRINQIKASTLFYGRDFGQIYFDNTETARLAINEFKDELTWYFTEYKDSL